MSAQLTRASARYLIRHPGQLVLAVVGVALGVAVVVAVELANDSARRAFALSMEAVNGPASHQIIGGPRGLDTALYTRLRVELGIRRSAPVVEGYARAGNQTLHILGIDPLAEPPDGRFQGVDRATVGDLMAEPGTVVLADVTAQRLGLSPGDHLPLTVGARERRVRLLETLPTTGTDRTALDGLLITDIATAQGLTGQLDHLSRIDLFLADDPPGDPLERIERQLPAGADIVPAAGRRGAMVEMTRAFHTNLTAMALLALVVGLFLIYNTMTFAVVQRRELMGRLRAIGVTPGQLLRTVLAEAAVIGLAGTALGLAAGIVLGHGLVGLVARTINDLYFAVTVTDVALAPTPLLFAVVLGLGGTIAAALPPALEAARTPPHAALARSHLEARARRLAPWMAATGVGLLLAGGGILSLGGRSLLAGFAALFLIILGLTLLMPLTLAGLARAGAGPAGHLAGVHGRLALRGVSASLSRTGVATAALSLAIATSVGVGVMIDSFRASVATWLATTLQADLFASAPGPSGGATAPALDPSLARTIAGLTGVRAVSTGRHVQLQSAEGLTELFVVDLPRSVAPRWRLAQGDPARVWPTFRAGEALLVSEPYAFRHAVEPGDVITLRTDRGPARFAVAGVYTDYSTGAGEVLMPRRLYRRHFDDPAITGIGVYLAEGADLETLAARIRAATTGGPTLEVVSNRELRRASMRIFDRTFTITGVLRMLAVIVAFVGILSALMALALERGREIAVLRATGFTPGQVAGLIVGQSGFMGLAAGVLALPTGLVLALLLIHVINQRAFGWSMDTLLEPAIAAQGVLLGVIAALAAGAYPAWRMARATPADGLREE